MHRTAAITAVEDRPQAGRKTASSSSSDSDELVAQILPPSQKSQSRSKAPIWWSNAIFFVSMHRAFSGVCIIVDELIRQNHKSWGCTALCTSLRGVHSTAEQCGWLS